MSKLIRHFQDVANSFQRSVTKFLQAYKDKIGPGPSIHCEIDIDDEVYKVYIRLIGIPKSASKKDKSKAISVYIDGFVVGEKANELCGYGTRISYVEVQANEFEYLEGFHFDYRSSVGETVQGGHPIFHAQLDKKAAERYVDDVLQGSAKPESPYALKGIRVPSAQMDAFSCALMVVADHLFSHELKDEFKQLVNEVHKLIPNVDIARHDSDTKKIFADKTTASGWYFASF